MDQRILTVQAANIPDVLPVRAPERIADVLPVPPSSAIAEVLPVRTGAQIPEVIPVPGSAAQVVSEVLPVQPVGRRSLPRVIWEGFTSAADWLFGAAALILGLAILAAIPVLQFLSLGYLLEACGRVARSGRLRDGFVGIRQASRLGSSALGVWLMFLPLRFLATLARSAQLIDPDGPVARGWQIGLTVLTILIAVHIIVACSRGGRLRYFLWPFTNPVWLARRLWRGGYYTEARDAVWDFVMALRLPYYFWLGLRGFCGTLLWLVVPVTLLALGRKVAPLGLLGALLLGIVVLYLPFLQARFAAENRLGAFLEIGAVRRLFRRAPWAYAFAGFVTLVFAVPLYLFRIEMIPREAAAAASLLFIVFIFPARLLTGWAYGRAGHRLTPRHWIWRWMARLGMLPVAALYVLFVFFSQYTTWDGIWSLYEQHAFLLPVPFTGM
jgi:hypothetical protein